MKTRYKKLLFVCKENTYLSPMAEIYFKHINNRIMVESRGTVVMFPEPYSAKMEQILIDDGLDVEEGLISKQIEEFDFGKDILVLTIDEKTKLSIYDDYLNAINVYTIAEYVGEDEEIIDPYGKDADTYKMCFGQIKRLLLKVSEKIKQEELRMISLGCDHGGYKLKEAIREYLTQKGYECHDFGCYNTNSCDYPDFGRAAAEAVADGRCKRGIVICSTGIGISIVANKVSGIRAALCTNTFMAKATREQNNANVLELGAKIVDKELAFEIVDTFLNTEFSNDERHIRRINKIEQ